MKLTIEPKEKCVTDLHIELPPERFEKEWQKMKDKYHRLAEVPGFRKGKAPRAVVEKKYADAIQEETIEHLIKAAVLEALDETDLSLIESPQLQEQHLGEDHSLRLLVSIVTFPQIELPNYKGLKISVEKESPSEAHIDKLIAEWQDKLSEFVNVEGRDLKMGDFAILDYCGKITETPLQELCDDLPECIVERYGSWLKLEKGRPVVGIAEALVGMKPHESRECRITFPEDFSEEFLRGIEVTYDVTLHEIKEQILPLIDDDFVAKIDPAWTAKTLRNEIKKCIEGILDVQFKITVRWMLEKELLSKVSCEIPDIMLEPAIDFASKKIIRECQLNDIPDEIILEHHEEVFNSSYFVAERKVRLWLILQAIAEEEKLEITPKELEQTLDDLLKEHEGSIQDFIDDVNQNKEAIQSNALSNKVMQMITSHAKITEIPVPSSFVPNNKGSSSVFSDMLEEVIDDDDDEFDEDAEDES